VSHLRTNAIARTSNLTTHQTTGQNLLVDGGRGISSQE
jgi:hypothetical protein